MGTNERHRNDQKGRGQPVGAGLQLAAPYYGLDSDGSAQSAAGCSRLHAARRDRTVWQRGHQNTVRPAISALRTVVPHTRQGRVWRWYT